MCVTSYPQEQNTKAGAEKDTYLAVVERAPSHTTALAFTS